MEAAPESLDLKRKLFERLDRAAPEHALLASNTSSLSIDEIASATGRPERVLGMHFFNPVHLMALLEVVRGERTAPETVDLVRECARAKLPVLVHAWRKTTGNMPDESDPTDCAALARAVPEAKVIMAHIGGVFHVGVRAARTAPSLLVDTSGSLNDNGMVERAVRELGAERVVFGTDLPGFGANNVGKVKGAAVGERERGLIFSGNILRLLGEEVRE